MINPQMEIQLLAALVAVTCTLSGTFLVLRKMAMMSDAISHSILAGIALAFLYTHDIHSPLLILGAAATGLFTVLLVEFLKGTGLLAEDTSIGLVFTALFSIGVIVISRYAGNVHLDVDAVLLGEIAFAPFHRLSIGGYDLGPKSFYVMGIIFIINILFITLFYKELKIVTFDPRLAAALGISPWIIHYCLMSVVSITAVGAFDAVGSILVVALMVVPPLTAYLLTNELENMLFTSGMLGIVIGVAGYQVARLFDVSIAGSMATVAGVLFLLVFLGSPHRGLIVGFYKRSQRKMDFARLTLLIHLYHHEHTLETKTESSEEHIRQFVRWSEGFTTKLIHQLKKQGMIVQKGQNLMLTDEGRKKALWGLKSILPF
ncbi:metal ABC transporter permease [Alkaliphilus crotonatoxidans]